MPKAARAPEDVLPMELYAMIFDELLLDHANEPEALRTALGICRLVWRSGAFYTFATEALFNKLTVSFDDHPAWVREASPTNSHSDSEDGDNRHSLGWNIAPNTCYGWEWNDSDYGPEDYRSGSDDTGDSDDDSDLKSGGSRVEPSLSEIGIHRSVAPSDSVIRADFTTFQGDDELARDTEQDRKSFERFYDFLVVSPHLCGYVRQLTLARKGSFGDPHTADPRGDISEPLLVDICNLLPNLTHLCLRQLVTLCKDPQGSLPDNQLTLDVLHLDMEMRCFEETMLLPLRIVRKLKHLVIGPLLTFDGDSIEECKTMLLVPALSPALFVEALHFRNCSLVFKFLKPLDRQTHVLKYTRHLRSDCYDSSDRTVVRRFLARHQASMKSLSLDLYAQREYDLPTKLVEARVFLKSTNQEVTPFMWRIEHLTLTDEFFYGVGVDSPQEHFEDAVTEPLQPCWLFAHAILSGVDDSEHLETITIVSHSQQHGWNWTFPPAELSTDKGVVVPSEIYKLIDEICDLHFPALKKFTLLSGPIEELMGPLPLPGEEPAVADRQSADRCRARYVRDVQKVFAKLHARGVLVIAECLDSSLNPDDGEVPPRKKLPYKILK